MSEIIGKSFDGDDIRIPLSDVARFLNDAGVEIDPATIQPVDDPRKAMLEEIRVKVNRIETFGESDAQLEDVLAILDEMEAKL